MIGRVHSIQISPGGVPKTPVPSALVDAEGIIGDRHVYKDHGGPDRALCLYSLELINELHRLGHYRIIPGALGENLTIRGLPWLAIQPGVVLVIGELRITVTGYAVPCKKIRPLFVGGDFSPLSNKLNPGWARAYASVSGTGWVRPGDLVTIL